MHLIAQMCSIYNMNTLRLFGGQVMAVAEMRAPVVGWTERVGGRHIMPVARMVAPAIGTMERVAGGHIMPVAEMRAPAVGGTERVAGGHIMPVAVMVANTVGGMGGCKPETGVGVECSTVAPLDKIDLPFPYVVVCRKLSEQRHHRAHCGIRERCTSDAEET